MVVTRDGCTWIPLTLDSKVRDLKFFASSFGKVSLNLKITLTGPKPSGKNEAGSSLRIPGFNGDMLAFKQPMDSEVSKIPSWLVSLSANPSPLPS